MQVLREEPEKKLAQTKLVPRVLVRWGFYLYGVESWRCLFSQVFCMRIYEMTITTICVLTSS